MRPRLQQFVDLVEHSLDALANGLALFAESGNLTFGGSPLALHCFGLRLNRLGVALCSRNLTQNRGKLSLYGVFTAFSFSNLALGGLLLLGQLLAQAGNLGLGRRTRLAFALYNLHCSQHFLLERLKLIDSNPRSHS